MKASAVNIINSNGPISDTEGEFDFNQFKKEHDDIIESKPIQRASDSRRDDINVKKVAQLSPQTQHEWASNKENSSFLEQSQAESTNNRYYQGNGTQKREMPETPTLKWQQESVTFFRRSEHRLQ